MHSTPPFARYFSVPRIGSRAGEIPAGYLYLLRRFTAEYPRPDPSSLIRRHPLTLLW